MQQGKQVDIDPEETVLLQPCDERADELDSRSCA
jgi:hypothetical protein